MYWRSTSSTSSPAIPWTSSSGDPPELCVLGVVWRPHVLSQKIQSYLHQRDNATGHDAGSLCYISREQRWTVSTWGFNQFISPLSFWRQAIYVVRSLTVNKRFYRSTCPRWKGAEPLLQSPRLIAKCKSSKHTHCPFSVSSGRMRLRDLGGRSDSQILSSAGHSQFLVYRLDHLILGVGRIVRVTSIGANALFLDAGGTNMCVSSKVFPTIVGDTIVFHNNKKNCLAQYCLSSGTLSPTSDESTSGNRIPSPCSIFYHILTCCFRQDCVTDRAEERRTITHS
ncbi:hypothetical protein U9M48_043672 [Paspalum notatum var. saurae]|uniref:DUF295 domain-containing protein n=1 Tax=Paspalum notatum var. saurae TaxID=547442 RepID=A0AAQ3XGQ6_PASNO